MSTYPNFSIQNTYNSPGIIQNNGLYVTTSIVVPLSLSIYASFDTCVNTNKTYQHINYQQNPSFIKHINNDDNQQINNFVLKFSSLPNNTNNYYQIINGVGYFCFSFSSDISKYTDVELYRSVTFLGIPEYIKTYTKYMNGNMDNYKYIIDSTNQIIKVLANFTDGMKAEDTYYIQLSDPNGNSYTGVITGNNFKFGDIEK